MTLRVDTSHSSVSILFTSNLHTDGNWYIVLSISAVEWARHLCLGTVMVELVISFRWNELRNDECQSLSDSEMKWNSETLWNGTKQRNAALKLKAHLQQQAACFELQCVVSWPRKIISGISDRGRPRRSGRYPGAYSQSLSEKCREVFAESVDLDRVCVSAALALT